MDDVDLLTIAAEKLDLPRCAICAELEAGRSLSEVAHHKNVDPKGLISAMMASGSVLIDELVVTGAITSYEAIRWRAELEKVLHEFMNENWSDFIDVGFGKEDDDARFASRDVILTSPQFAG